MSPADLAARLQLTRPLCFIDCETTQPHELARPRADQDNIVQFGVVKLFPDGATKQFKTLVKPLLAITAESTKHHGITADMVADAPTWREAGPGIVKGLEGCDLAGYYVKNYDLPLLRAECERHRIHGPEPDEAIRIVDSYAIAAAKERRDLSWAVQFYTGQELQNAHQADADAAAVLGVLAGQLERYDDLPAGVAALHAWAFPVDPTWVDPDGKLQWRDGQVVITFGDQAGTPVAALEQGMVNWILRKNFSPKVKRVVQDIRRGVYPDPPAQAVQPGQPAEGGDQ